MPAETSNMLLYSSRTWYEKQVCSYETVLQQCIG